MRVVRFGVPVLALALVAIAAAPPGQMHEQHIRSDVAERSAPALEVAAHPLTSDVTVIGPNVLTTCTVGIRLEVQNGVAVDTVYGMGFVPCPSYDTSADSAAVHRDRLPNVRPSLPLFRLTTSRAILNRRTRAKLAANRSNLGWGFL